MSAAQVQKAKEPIKHTFSTEVDIDPDFVEYLTKFNDIFQQNRSGTGPSGRQGQGRLATSLFRSGWRRRDAHRQAIREAKSCYGGAHDGNLPKGWYVLDRDAAIRAWCEGVERWGVEWYEDVDAERETSSCSRAPGEIRYGYSRRARSVNRGAAPPDQGSPRAWLPARSRQARRGWRRPWRTSSPWADCGFAAYAVVMTWPWRLPAVAIAPPFVAPARAVMASWRPWPSHRHSAARRCSDAAGDDEVLLRPKERARTMPPRVAMQMRGTSCGPPYRDQLGGSCG